MSCPKCGSKMEINPDGGWCPKCQEYWDKADLEEKWEEEENDFEGSDLDQWDYP